jgi:hypothetical protein
MSDMKSNDRAQAAMRDQKSTNLNSGAPQYPKGPSQSSVSAETKARFAKSHPGPYRQDSAPEMPKDPLWGGKPPIPPEHI